MKIQLARQCDIPALLDLLRQVGQVHHQIRPDIFPAGMQKYDENALGELLLDANRPIFVAVEGQQVQGYCFCVVKDLYTGETCRREFYIDDLCVDENHRRKGLAQALYRHALEQARFLDCHSLTLNVWCGNDGAMEFYKNMGMTQRNIMMETRL